MDSLFRHWLPCLLLCGFATGVAAQPFVHQKNRSTFNCSPASLFPTAGGTQQTSDWSYCFETRGPTLTVLKPPNPPKTYQRIYQERAGLLIPNTTTVCGSNIDTCHKNVRICLLDTATNMPAGAGVFVPETNGNTGGGGCATFFTTNFKCGVAPVCCTNEEDCPTPRLAVVINGEGRVQDEPFEGRRIDCPGTCFSVFGGGNWTVSLIATADDGVSFEGWGGACSGTEKCIVPLNKGDQTVTATFVREVGIVPATTTPSVRIPSRSLLSSRRRGSTPPPRP